MDISGICNRKVRHVLRDTSLLVAARRMREEHVGDLVVVEMREGFAVPVGVLTDRDIVTAVLAKASEHLEQLNVGDVIDSTLVTASEGEDLSSVLKRMRSFEVRRVPVVDARDTLTGVLSVDDMIPALSEELAEVAALVSRQARREAQRRP